MTKRRRTIGTEREKMTNSRLQPKVWAGGALASLLLLAGCSGGSFTDSDDSGSEETSKTVESSEQTEVEETTDEVEDIEEDSTSDEVVEEDVTEEEEEPAEVAEEGTRDNPYPTGTTVTSEEWEVTLGDPYEAWDVIYSENEFNEAPEEGEEVWLVPMTATYIGNETGDTWDLGIAFVSDDGVTYDECWALIPDDIADVGELYNGGTAEGNKCATIPEGAEGTWTLRDMWTMDAPVFFDAR